jgi:Asp-tRNA(Asn)/Glu-tRNA(Gln) amidotransferase A subunit family amidase
MTTRRTFLSLVAAGALPWRAGRLPSLAPLVQDDAAASSRARAITTETVAEAEKILGVSFTPAERELMVRTLPGQRDNARMRPKIPFGVTDAPATVFQPAQNPGERSPAAAAAPIPREVAADEAGVAFASIADLGAALRAKRLTAVELARIFFDRLLRSDHKLKAVVTLCDDRAFAEARRADQELAAGKDRGPLHGIPYGVKDLFDTAGIRTTWGAAPFKDRVPQVDSDVVNHLTNAGAVLLAKLSVGELAMGDVWFGGRTNSPWNQDEGSSGSSAGSCSAVAAGCMPFAIGTETLGSIVSPSMRCGTTGLRPTFGLVSLGGAMPLCWSLDKAGPITRSPADAWTVLRALTPARGGAFAPAHLGSEVRGLKVGYVPAWFEGRSEAGDLDRKVLDALKDAGCELVAVSLPEFPYATLRTILTAEAAASMEDVTLSGKDDALAQQGPNSWPNIFRAARFISAVDFIQADRLRRRIIDAFGILFRPLDAMVGPSFGNPMLLATNFTGQPCLVVRTGFVKSRPRNLMNQPESADSRPAREVPYGISLWAKTYDEATLVRLGSAIEARMGVADRRPEGF